MSDNKTLNNNFDLEKAYNESFKNIHENVIIKAKVVDISNEIVFLDFGYKSEAKIPSADFETLPNIGDEIEVFLIRLEGRAGEPVVSKQIVEKIKEKKELKRKWREKELVTGIVKEITKNGCIVACKSLTGFIPLSLFDSEKINSLDEFLNKEIKFYIEKINFNENDIFQRKSGRKNDRNDRREEEFLGNRKKYVLDENNILKKKFFEEAKEGDIINGTVKALTDFGAFIDIGGVDALLRVKDVSWARVNKVEDVLKLGQELQVKILSLNKESKKVAVGLKQTLEDPWNVFSQKYKVDDVIVGTVVAIATYGAFIKIIDGVEGLLHISDMSWIKKINNPSELMKVGQKLELKIINIDTENRKISLSLKHMLENPWDQVKEKYKIGTIVKGKVKTVTTFGFFLELEEGIDALLHIDDISWTETIKSPHNLYKTGDEIEVMVIQCEPNKSKIKVGIKQLKDDPWKSLNDKYNNGDVIECEIDKIDYEKGLSVKITDEISSFIPLEGISFARKHELKDILKSNFKVGDKVKAMIISFEPKRKLIKVSIKEYLKKEEREKVKTFLHDTDEDSKYTLGDALKNKIENK